MFSQSLQILRRQINGVILRNASKRLDQIVALVTKISLIFFVVAGSNSCSQDSLYNESCPNTESLSDSTTLSRVDIFMETSGSMSILMPQRKTTSFQKVVPDFISRLSKVWSTRFFSITDSSKPFIESSPSEALSKISLGTFKWGSATSIPEMIDSIYHYQTDSSVSVFITDGIYSPGVKKNTDLIVTLASQPFSKYSKNGYATHILCVQSDVGVIQSPYYVIVFGGKKNSGLVKEKITNSLRLINTDYQEYMVGLADLNVPSSALPSYQLQGDVLIEPCNDSTYLVASFGDQTQPIEFWLGIDLKQLPHYATETAYLKSNLSSFSDGCKVEITEIATSLPLTDLTDKIAAKRLTHFIKLRISEIQMDRTEIDFLIRYQKPNWIDGLNTDDPMDRTKTAGLKNLILGVEDAYNYHLEDVAFVRNVKMVLKKN